MRCNFLITLSLCLRITSSFNFVGSRVKIQLQCSSSSDLDIDTSKVNSDADALLMAKINGASDNNVMMRWTLEDDKILYEGFKVGESLEDLCDTLKRGYQGCKARLNHLNNPNHKAYMRYFGTKIEESSEVERISLRPCMDCIERIIWDPLLDINDFSFIYEDRFDGLYEKPCGSTNENVKGPERMLVKAVPEHRIQSLKYKERVVWDKKDRMDLIFGSSPGLSSLSQPSVDTGDKSKLIWDNRDKYNDYIYNEEIKKEGDEEEIKKDHNEENSNTDERTDMKDLDSVLTDEDLNTDTGVQDEWSDDDAVWGEDDDKENQSKSKAIRIEEVISTYDIWLESRIIKENEIIEKKRNMAVFCDLDGVLVDFEAGVQALFRKKKTAEISPKLLWPKLATTPDFYNTLPWMEDGKLLWEAIEKLDPVIITGLPRGNWAEPQKRAWTSRELGPQVKVITCPSKDKFLHCLESGSLLIDDRAVARESWENAGGIFLLHISIKDTLQQLKDMGIQVPETTDKVDNMM